MRPAKGMERRVGIAIVCLLYSTCIAPRPATAAVIDSFWLGGNGNWTVAALWSPDIVPGNNTSRKHSVFIDGGQGVGSVVNCNTTPTISHLSVDADDILLIPSPQIVRFELDPLVECRGLIAGHGIFIESGELQLFGQGTLRLEGTGTPRINGGTHLNNTQARIEGYGIIHPPQISNAGIVDANVADRSLTVSFSTSLGNTGTMQASGGGTLILSKSGTEELLANNTGGTIQALTGSIVELQAAGVNGYRIEGGLIQGIDGGEVRFLNFGDRAAKLQDLTLAGRVVGGANSHLVLAGAIENTGTLVLDPVIPNANIVLRLRNTVTLRGAGEVELSPITDVFGGRSFVEAETMPAHLINEGNTFRGAGEIGRDQVQITNQGVFLANGTASMKIDPSNAGFLNQGELQVVGPGGMEILEDGFVNEGVVTIEAGSQLTRVGDYVQTGGTTRVDGIAIVSGVVDIQGGVLSGSGTVDGDVILNGVFAPGSSPGRLTLDGEATFQSSLAFAAELGGLLAGEEHDAVVVTGGATLAGNLVVTFVNGFVPAAGDEFELVTAASVSGQFDSVGLPPGTFAEVRYEATRVVLAISNVVAVIESGSAAGDELSWFPNPVGASGAEFRLGAGSKHGRSTLALFDPTGRRVFSAPVDRERIRWDGADDDGRPVRPGVYFVRLFTERGVSEVRTLVIVR